MPVTQPPYPADPHAPAQQPYGAPTQTPYGAPAQTPYGYGSGPQAPYGSPYPPNVPPPTDGMAIAALVGGLTVGPVGVILGFVALSRIRRSGAKGRGLATAGMVLGGLTTIVAVLLVVFSGAFDTSPSKITSERSIAADALEAGHCANFDDLNNAGAKVKVVPCGDAHDTEILGDVGKGQLIAGMIDAQTTLGPLCADLVADLAGADAAWLSVYVLPIVPADAKDGINTRYLCAAAAPDPTITGSFVFGDGKLG